MEQDEDEKKTQEEERKEEEAARFHLERPKKSDSSTPTKEKKDVAHELAKIKLDRDWYKRDCENKERQIEEYHETLAQYKTQLETKIEEEAIQKKYRARLKEFQAKLNEVKEENKKLKEQLSEKEVKRMSLLTKNEEIEMHKLNKEEIVKILMEKEERIKELVERLQLKETENAIITEDFASERSDRERSHAQLTDLKEKCKILEEELIEREQALAEAQMKYHNLQQSYSTIEHDLEESQKRFMELMKKETESSETIQSLTEKKKKTDKQLKEIRQLETDRMKEMEEEIQVLTAQVNAYSRECEKQKGLVAQNQERHKTEIQELNEKLTNEQKSKQQLESQLTTMKQHLDSVSASKESLHKSSQKLVNELAILRQQFDTLTASKESLLTAYNQEQAMVTSLEQQLQRLKEESARMKKANEVLKDKVLSLKQQPSSQTANPVVSSHPNIPPKISMRQNTINSAPPTGSNPTPARQGGGNAEIVFVKGQQVAPPPHAEQPDSVPDDTPHMSEEEIFRLFKWQNQQDDSGRATVTQTPQQVEDLLVKERRRQELAQKAEEALLEVERMRKQPPRKTMLPQTSSKQESVNQQQPKKKIKQQKAAADDSDTDIEENVLLEGIDDEIHEMAEEVREMSRRPDTQEVLFDDNDRPYDPNLVCRKCGKQYREGEIQKLKRHLSTNCDNDDCDGNIRKDQMTKEIHDMAEEVRGMSRRPDTQEVLFDDEDSSLPYDPNLVCPKCGRQYREGEIQKLKRHINEFCTGKR